MEDSGTIVNRQLVDEQIGCSATQGLRATRFEHCSYDDCGQVLIANMTDYMVAMAGEMPDIVVGHMSPLTADSTLGAKGADQAGTAEAAPTVVNALNNGGRRSVL